MSKSGNLKILSEKTSKIEKQTHIGKLINIYKQFKKIELKIINLYLFNKKKNVFIK